MIGFDDLFLDYLNEVVPQRARGQLELAQMGLQERVEHMSTHVPLSPILIQGTPSHSFKKKLLIMENVKHKQKNFKKVK